MLSSTIYLNLEMIGTELRGEEFFYKVKVRFYSNKKIKWGEVQSKVVNRSLTSSSTGGIQKIHRASM